MSPVPRACGVAASLALLLVALAATAPSADGRRLRQWAGGSFAQQQPSMVTPGRQQPAAPFGRAPGFLPAPASLGFQPPVGTKCDPTDETLLALAQVRRAGGVVLVLIFRISKLQ